MPERPNIFDIKLQCYAMASRDGRHAEITMYGDVVERRPRNYWTGKELEGSFIVQDEFLNDLDTVKGCETLTIRLNSYGGDAVVGLLIHNRLRELSRDGMKLTAVVDAVAMSAASVIMAACDTVRINPGGLVMIHRAAALQIGWYNADELQQEHDAMTAYDEALAEAYVRKTGLDRAKVIGMMADTTYLTGREAVERGFADELIEDAEPLQLAASADGTRIFAGGRAIHLAPGMSAPDFIPTAPEGADPEQAEPAQASQAAAVDANTNPPDEPGNEGGLHSMTLDELRAQEPELVQQIENAAAQTAVEAERARLQRIDEVAGLFDDALVAEAKYGAGACSAQELAFRAAQAAAKAGTAFLSDLAKDAKASGTGGVAAAEAPENEDEPVTNEARMAAGEEMGRKIAATK